MGVTRESRDAGPFPALALPPQSGRGPRRCSPCGAGLVGEFRGDAETSAPPKAPQGPPPYPGRRPSRRRAIRHAGGPSESAEVVAPTEPNAEASARSEIPLEPFAPTEPNSKAQVPFRTVDVATMSEPDAEAKVSCATAETARRPNPTPRCSSRLRRWTRRRRPNPTSRRKSRPGRLKCSRRPNPTRSSSPTRSRPRPNPPRVAKRCGPNTAVVLVERLRSAVAEATVVDLGFPVAALLLALGVLRGERRLLVLGDGASGIRTWFEGLGVCPKARIVCWSHLRKRCSEKMSSAGGPKDRRHAWERDLLGQLWQGEVDAEVDLPRVVLEWVKNPQAVEVLIASLGQRRASIPDSQRRLELVTGAPTGERQAKMEFATRLATRYCGGVRNEGPICRQTLHSPAPRSPRFVL